MELPENTAISQAPRWLAEFLCFTPALASTSAEILADNPPPSSFWRPKFLVSVRASGQSDFSEVRLQAIVERPQAPLRSNFPAIVSARETIERQNGSDVRINYCPDGSDGSGGLTTSRWPAVDCTNDNLQAGLGLFDPNQVPAIGSAKLTETGTASETSRFCGVTMHNKCFTPDPNDGSQVGSGHQLTAKLEQDSYFSQYFGSQDRNAVFALMADKTTTLTADEFIQALKDCQPKAEDCSLNQPGLLKIEGDVHIDTAMDLRKLGHPDLVLYIEGSLNVKSAVTLPNAALTYVAGNVTMTGSLVLNSTLAVEENLTMNQSLEVLPYSDPREALANLTSPPTLNSRGRLSWRQL